MTIVWRRCVESHRLAEFAWRAAVNVRVLLAPVIRLHGCQFLGDTSCKLLIQRVVAAQRCHGDQVFAEVAVEVDTK